MTFFLLLALWLVPETGDSMAGKTNAALVREARAAYDKGEKAVFLAIYEELARRRPGDVYVLYNLACAQSLNGRGEAAVRTLEGIAAHRSTSNLDADDDFAPIRQMDGYKNVVGRMNALRKERVASGAERAFTIPEKGLVAEGVANHPDFDEPTLGVVVDRAFYFSADSQGAKFRDAKNPIAAADMRDSVILKVALPGDETRATLQRQTQELLDAIATGAASVWDRYLDPEVRFVDESGKVMGKKEMVESTKPLPAGVSGVIRVLDFDAAVHGETAVTTYVADEDEVFHGHKLHCQYRSSDTWKKTPEGWRLIASQIMALRSDPPAITLSAKQRQEYCGTYSLAPDISYEIRCAGDKLEGQQTGRKAEPLLAEAPDVLFVPGKPRYRKVFQRGPDGRITGFAERREEWDLVWKRVPGG